MMKKRIVLMMMVVMLTGTYFTMDACAAQQWYTCTVDLVGAGATTSHVQLTSSAFTLTWFEFPVDRQKEMLAVALTAMSSGMQVIVLADLAVGSTIHPIYGFYVTQ